MNEKSRKACFISGVFALGIPDLSGPEVSDRLGEQELYSGAPPPPTRSGFPIDIFNIH